MHRPRPLAIHAPRNVPILAIIPIRIPLQFKQPKLFTRRTDPLLVVVYPVGHLRDDRNGLLIRPAFVVVFVRDEGIGDIDEV